MRKKGSVDMLIQADSQLLAKSLKFQRETSEDKLYMTQVFQKNLVLNQQESETKNLQLKKYRSDLEDQIKANTISGEGQVKMSAEERKMNKIEMDNIEQVLKHPSQFTVRQSPLLAPIITTSQKSP